MNTENRNSYGLFDAPVRSQAKEHIMLSPDDIERQLDRAWLSLGCVATKEKRRPSFSVWNKPSAPWPARLIPMIEAPLYSGRASHRIKPFWQRYPLDNYSRPPASS